MKVNETFDGHVIPKKTKWLYSVSAAGRDAAYALVSMFLLTYIQYSGILTPAGVEVTASQYAAMFGVISALVIVYRIFDALNDPFMGVLVEKVHMKLGKYKPWILIGCLTNSLTVFCLFCVPQWTSALQGWGYVWWFAIWYLLWGMTFTMNDVSYWAMMPSLSSDAKERTSITTLMQIFCSVGQFSVAALAPIFATNFGYQSTYMTMTIIVIAVFLILQVLLVLFAKEHTRDLEAEKNHPAASFKDMFAVLKNNNQTRWAVIIILIYYTGSGILNSLGMNYFYFAVGYSAGGTAMTLFTVIYGLGVIIATFLFPLLSSKFTRKQLFTGCIILTIIGYVAFFIYGLPLGDGNYISPAPTDAEGNLNMVYMIPLFLIGLFIFFAQGVIGMILIMQNQNTIEYNEWKTGERKESVILSLRSLSAKLASSIQQGVLYLFLACAGLLSIINTLSSYQQELAMGTMTSEAVTALSNAACLEASTGSIIIYKAGVAILPMVLILVCYILSRKFYKIDEKMYDQIVKEIDERKHANEESSENNPELAAEGAAEANVVPEEVNINEHVEEPPHDQQNE